MSAQVDPWDSLELSPQDQIDVYKGNDKKDAWDELGFEEGFWKSAFRYAAQPGQGALEMTTPGLMASFWQLLGMGEALDPEGIEQLKEVSEREGIPFNEESYMKAAQEALGHVPTVSNIARGIEEQTGIPLEPQTTGQKALRLGSSAFSAAPGTIIQKGVAGVGAPIAKEALEQLGVPEPLAEPLGFGLGLGAGTKAPKIDIGKAKGESGLTKRRYENLQKPTEVSPGKIQQITEKTEQEFRKITDEILSKSPIEETYSGLKNDTEFKHTAREAFKEVEQLSETMPEKFSTKDLKKELADHLAKKKGTGFLASEYEKNHKKFITQFIKETPDQEINAFDLVRQFRKNNKGFGEIKEPGQSYAYNQAKRDALRDYNIGIENLIQKKFKDTEFAQIFPAVNKRWSEIMDAETIDQFMGDMFDGKIKFKEGENFFEKNGMQVPFKRAMGEKGFADFERLMKDLMTKEKAYGMMKAAEKKGFTDLAKTGLAYLIHPKVGWLKLGIDMSRAGYTKLWEALIDKPQLALTWDRGVKAFKKGDFAKAEQEFKTLKGEILEAEKAPVEAKEGEIIEVHPERIEEPMKAIDGSKLGIEAPSKALEETPAKTSHEINQQIDKQTDEILNKGTVTDLLENKEIKALENTRDNLYREEIKPYKDAVQSILTESGIEGNQGDAIMNKISLGSVRDYYVPPQTILKEVGNTKALVEDIALKLASKKPGFIAIDTLDDIAKYDPESVKSAVDITKKIQNVFGIGKETPKTPSEPPALPSLPREKNKERLEKIKS